MTDIADQRADRVIEVTSQLIELRAVQKVYRAGKLEYVAVRGVDLAIVTISMLGLLNAITMSIRERTREIGVLRAIGAWAQDVRRIFRTETLSLAALVVAGPLRRATRLRPGDAIRYG